MWGQRRTGAQRREHGPRGALASLFSRGGESDYNLVLIDGIRANITGGRFNFSRVSAGEIERVEVVRGAQSSLYGSAAIGSVVHLMTRRALPTDPPMVLGSVEGGTFATRRGELSLLGDAMQRLDYKASITFRSSDGALRGSGSVRSAGARYSLLLPPR